MGQLILCGWRGLVNGVEVNGVDQAFGAACVANRPQVLRGGRKLDVALLHEARSGDSGPGTSAARPTLSAL